MFTFLKKEKLKALLHEHGATTLPHTKMGTLYDHLLRVGHILEGWGLDEHTVLAGMAHSVYATEVFQTAILPLHKRDDLREIIGQDAESLVYAFCILKRNSLRRDGEHFVFTNRISGEDVECTHETATGLMHILVANQIDHLTIFNVQAFSNFFKQFTPWRHLLCEKAQAYLRAITPPDPEKRDTYIRFVAHAGVHLTSKDVRLVVDPWLYPATLRTPKIQGFDPDSSSIDYLIPEPRNTLRDIAADIILLSHLHTHHSPLREIKELASLRPVNIVCPSLSERKQQMIRDALGEEVFNKITFHFLEKDTELTIKGIRITCLTHTLPNHFAYFIQCDDLTFLHIADAAANAEFNSLLFDDIWKKFHDLRPDYLFVAAAGHALRRIEANGERAILENTTLTPIQAAKLAYDVGAKHAGIIGVYNFSIWNNRIEYAKTYEAAESEFYWALSFLSPAIRIMQYRPGDILVKNM